MDLDGFKAFGLRKISVGGFGQDVGNDQVAFFGFLNLNSALRRFRDGARATVIVRINCVLIICVCNGFRGVSPRHGLGMEEAFEMFVRSVAVVLIAHRIAIGTGHGRFFPEAVVVGLVFIVGVVRDEGDASGGILLDLGYGSAPGLDGFCGLLLVMDNL